MSNPERITDIGPPNYQKFLPPIVKKNYGKWAYHEVPEPGVLLHVGESGDKLYSVRASSPRLLAITTIRQVPCHQPRQPCRARRPCSCCPR